ncbi:hypothetical protein RhiirC2_712442 [Rhizophagus irregularis]|uniref:RNase H type-1 domain-containing protein n=1 Tax=Rhizophagus irregularis TaxID=588596 RepID=A0A2N1N749_9GLOM|nr:hypothetical protein RhiirC2_712442 [Rhizophagus irregularis]
MERNQAISNKQKRLVPEWYKYLYDNIVINQHNLRLNFDLPPIKTPNPMITHPKIIPQSSNTMRIKNIWIAYWCPRTNNVIFRRVIEKHHFYHHHQTITFEHYLHIPDSHPSHSNFTPRSHPTYLSKCTGCNLSEITTLNNSYSNTYYITSLSDSTIIINTSKSNLNFTNYNKPFYKCNQQISTIKQKVIIDYNIRNTNLSNSSPLPNNPILYQSSLEQHIDLEKIHILNRNLILQLVTPNSLHIPLLKITLSLSSYNNLEFYTDGSLNREYETPIMGYGWIFTSNLVDNIKHSGSCKDWPSSSKAELVAILTSLIVCPPNSNIHIHTDSAACIATFNSLYSPKLTARQFQKLNNCTLWNTIKHIINTLKLKVSLFKVKVHSGHALNDAADLLAKNGILSKDFFQINIQYLPTQRCHLTFNDSIIIDRNIRKSVKRIINFQYFEQHLSHQNLHKLKDYTLDNIIDWEFSQLWFKYNPFTKLTSEKYSKHVSWQIKCSSYNLPTLDILNRNYPEFLKENVTPI